MYQPEVKYQFILKYCPPEEGWFVHVDIDGAEMGKTGGNKKTKRQREDNWKKIEPSFRKHKNIIYNGHFKKWFKEKCPKLASDDERIKYLQRRDIFAFHPKKGLLIAEIESESSEKEQPERKIYSAVGQLSRAIDELSGFNPQLIVAINGERLEEKLERVTTALKMLRIQSVTF